MSFSSLRSDANKLIGDPKAALLMAALAYRFPKILIEKVINEWPDPGWLIRVE